MLFSLIFMDVQPRALEVRTRTYSHSSSIVLGRVEFILALTLLTLPRLCTYAASMVVVIALTGAAWCGDNVTHR
jgi:hypothetical protein